MRMNQRYDARAAAPRYRIARVDPDAEARRLVDEYANLILRLSYTYLKSTHDAQDICQNVLLKLIERQGSFESAEHEKAWVVRTTANACKDLLRSAYRRTSAPLEAAADASVAEPEESTVLDAVMALDEMYREAIYLHYYEGYSIAEIAAITNRTVAAVGAHLSRGRAKLRAALGEAAAAEFGCGEGEGAADSDDVEAGKHAPRAPDAAGSGFRAPAARRACPTQAAAAIPRTTPL